MHRLVASCAIAVFVVVVAQMGSHRAAGAGAPVTTKLVDPHMEITLRRLPQNGDRERADAVVASARALVAKYANVADAQRDGYSKFLPRLKLPEEHFTNAAFAREAWLGTFRADHPTSLIYKRDGDALHIVGVMYTAANSVSEAELDRRIPMSVGTWHRHVNLCWGPPGGGAYFGPHAKFGMSGSIWTSDACAAANGTFLPIAFDWMIHVWPNAATQAAMWSIHGEDAASDMAGEHEHHAMGDGRMATTPVSGPLPIPLDHLPALEIGGGNAAHGATVFAANCASCHGTSGRAGPDAPELAGRGIGAGQVAFMVRNPATIDVTSEMPRLPLSDNELADVSAYVSHLK